jgi:ABC-type branched-subunit amino acid transport system substrate-binding protein
MQRRNFIAAAAASVVGGALGFPGLALAQPSVVKFGQSAALSGPLGEEGSQLRNGILAAFDAASKTDSKGPRFELVSLDDANAPGRCADNIKSLAGSNIAGLVGLTSGAGAEAALPVIEQNQLALLGTASGSMELRSDNAAIFNVRAGYDLEFKRMVTYVRELGLKRVGVVYLQETSPRNLAAATQALAEVGLVPAEMIAIDGKGNSYQAAFEKLVAAKLESVLFMTNAEPIVAIVPQMRKAEFRGPVFAASLAGQGLLDTLVAQRQSAILSLVVPRTSSINLSVVNRCQQDLAVLNNGSRLTASTLEGYISGRIAVEATRSAMQNGTLNKARLRDALSRLRTDLGGYKVAFEPGSSQGSKYVELISVDRFGRIVG